MREWNRGRCGIPVKHVESGIPRCNHSPRLRNQEEISRLLTRFYRGFAVTLMVLAPTISGAASFTPLPEGLFGRAISADGSTVVGGSQAFVWDSVNGTRFLGTLPGGLGTSTAYAVSGDGSIVVGQSYSTSGNEAFIWDREHGMRGLGRLTGFAIESGAFGISTDGSVVTGDSSSDRTTQAFRWDAANGMQGIGELPGGGIFSRGLAISDDGSTVVGRSMSSQGEEAYRWDVGTGMRGLGDVPGGSFFSVAYAVSADGSTVVGTSRNSSGNEAFIWSPSEGIRGLGTLGDGWNSNASDVSADGSTVVGTSVSLVTFENRAIIWDQEHGLRSLSAVLASQGVDLNGWTLDDAMGISADGRTVLGLGRSPSGTLGSWIAVIPEPGVGVLLSIGLVILGCGRETRAERDKRQPRKCVDLEDPLQEVRPCDSTSERLASLRPQS